MSVLGVEVAWNDISIRRIIMGRKPDESLRMIRTHGGMLDRDGQREKLLKVGLKANVDKQAKYVVITGCHPIFSLAPVKSFTNCLHHFGINYTFLSSEICCGHPIIESMFRQKVQDEGKRQHYEDYTYQCLEKSYKQARDLGSRKIVTICPGCNTTWNRYYGDQDVDVMHYLDLLLIAFSGSSLSRNIDFYEGCHKLHNFVPDFQDSMIQNSKDVLSRIQGLTVNEISSSICCRVSPQKVFSASKTETIVTPSGCCYTQLTKSNSENGPNIKFIAEIVYESLTAISGRLYPN
jgi:Fe-S oxidoreductase